jgi:lysozyme
MDQPAKPQPTPAQKKGKAYAMLCVMCGTALTTAMVADISNDEGRRLISYKDIKGVVTNCDGNTKNAKLGQTFTNDQCDEITAEQLLVHAKIVIRCVPAIQQERHGQQLRAAANFDYNTGAFCGGSPGRYMARDQWKAGCDAMLAYNGIVTVGKPYAGALEVRRLKPDAKGRPRFFNVVRGLKLRRERQHAICVAGL